MLRTEFGGMCEALADLADLTGDHRYAALARRFLDESLLSPLREHRDVLDGMHANTQIAKAIGYQRLGEIADDPGLRDAARFFWQTVTRHRTFSFGGNSVREHLHPRDDFSSALQSPEGPETCNTYNMLKLGRALFLEQPDAEVLDHYERATVNHILAPSASDAAAGVRRLAPDRLAFALDHTDAPSGEPVTLVPFAGIHDSRYHLYFPLAEPERLQERREQLRAADAAELTLHDRTVDAVAAGEQQPESDHRFAGHDTWSGLTDGQRWRAATGWRSYHLTDRDGTATALQLTHLSDTSAGPTRVLADGHPLGTLTPTPDPEGEEITHTFPLHTDRPAGPVEVRFEAVGPTTTVRLREVRLVSPE
ncbi:beta-L-arabinofuranosidase domain-containing protein [Kitasatospora misakiensis]|uniref:Beta-L-arabinofuranosidase domain-containing protein n=1 Tax=Kitasatospora misakiensis TaxID=67330 RepID=A0ABW0X5V5_9ACTN